jgi:hypothetical protein
MGIYINILILSYKCADFQIDKPHPIFNIFDKLFGKPSTARATVELRP